MAGPSFSGEGWEVSRICVALRALSPQRGRFGDSEATLSPASAIAAATLQRLTQVTSRFLPSRGPLPEFSLSGDPAVLQSPGHAAPAWPSCSKPTQSFRNLSLPALLNPGSPRGNPHCQTCLKNRMIFPHGELGDSSSSQHSHWQKDTLPGVLWCP